MGLSQEIQKRIKQKEAEIGRLESELQEIDSRIRIAKAYIQGLVDILPRAEREEKDDGGPTSTSVFRPGSMPDRVKAILEKEGAPLHIAEILKRLGKETSKGNRLSVSGTLARCVRAGLTFSRPAPNTFGLRSAKAAPTESEQEDLIPAEFGK